MKSSLLTPFTLGVLMHRMSLTSPATLGPIAALLLMAAVCICLPARADHRESTFSIVAFDPETQELGVAVQSRAFSVGGGVPWARAGVGAIATQASTNESFGPRGLALLETGLSASDVLARLVAADEESPHRQLGIVDARGRSAAFTGESCLDWAGHRTGAHFAIQGNILAGEPVVDAMVRAFEETEGELSERLLAALHAAQAAGGDTRGQQSAALLVVRPSDEFPEYETRYVDLHVEDHETPIDELERVFRIHQASDLLRAHTRYAALHDSLGNEQAARRERERIGDALDHALSRTDVEASTLNALAWYCATADVRLEEALEAAKRAVELEPESAEILDTLAEVQFRLGKVEEAIATIDRAIELDPEQEYYRNQRTRFLESR